MLLLWSVTGLLFVHTTVSEATQSVHALHCTEHKVNVPYQSERDSGYTSESYPASINTVNCTANCRAPQEFMCMLNGNNIDYCYEQSPHSCSPTVIYMRQNINTSHLCGSNDTFCAPVHHGTLAGPYLPYHHIPNSPELEACDPYKTGYCSLGPQGQTIIGNDIISYIGITRKECCAICWNTTGCKAWVWLDANCTLKNAAEPVSNVSTLSIVSMINFGDGEFTTSAKQMATVLFPLVLSGIEVHLGGSYGLPEHTYLTMSPANKRLCTDLPQSVNLASLKCVLLTNYQDPDTTNLELALDLKNCYWLIGFITKTNIPSTSKNTSSKVVCGFQVQESSQFYLEFFVYRTIVKRHVNFIKNYKGDTLEECVLDTHTYPYSNEDMPTFINVGRYADSCYCRATFQDCEMMINDVIVVEGVKCILDTNTTANTSLATVTTGLDTKGGASVYILIGVLVAFFLLNICLFLYLKKKRTWKLEEAYKKEKLPVLPDGTDPTEANESDEANPSVSAESETTSEEGKAT